ncbi:MAG TPA: phosphoenolpyruvate carboxylase [Coriobacteriia bacterium]|jgi:phosphoenolpyruvate carboxylase
MIPRCMSTQHPDNVQVPFFAERSDLGGEDEIREAYYAYADLGCDEQMWDVEGKEVDTFVVKKLLSRYETFFREKQLGRDLRLTLRVPNPEVERAEAKILLETLESIPRSYDAARLFYGADVTPPICEVILPMTTSAEAIDRVYRYYTDFIIRRQQAAARPGDITIAEWIGEFRPERISVIPLFEDHEHLLAAADITREYLRDKDVGHQRVFLARSDPAMNYGLVSAVLLIKIALSRLHAMSRDTGVAIYPILGMGSAPFRGNLTPHTVDGICDSYPSVHTFTIQSAFKYDHSPAAVSEAIAKLMTRETGAPREVDAERALEIVERYSAEYRRQVIALAKVINEAARFVPSRRTRKLHIGLFGYARDVGGVRLPRVISFTAALYSVGLPPELLGLSALTADDLAFVRDAFGSFDRTLQTALRFADLDGPFMPAEVRDAIRRIGWEVEQSEQHLSATRRIVSALGTGDTTHVPEQVLRAAHARKFLG